MGSEPRRFSLWSKSETRLWTWTLFLGTLAVYSARVALPICAVSVGREYKWTKAESGTVLSCFFWGYASTQVLAGWLADRFGGERVLAVTTFFWSAITFMTPHLFHWAYHTNYPIQCLIALRVAMGLTQGFHFPCMASLVSKRLTASEKGRVFGIVTAGSHAGTVLAGSFGSVILESMGWDWVFYFIGSLGLVWWVYLRYLSTVGARHVGRWRDEEKAGLRALISSSQSSPSVNSLPDIIPASPPGSPSSKGPASSPVPWAKLFSQLPFWAAFCAHYCGANAYFTLFSWLPSYFTENYPEAKGWVFNVVPNLAIVTTALLAPAMASSLISKGYSMTTVRKLMEGGSLAGLGLCLLMVATVDSYTGALFFLALAMGLRGLHHAGVNVNPQDFAPNHTGAVFGVMNLGAAIPGFVGVYVAGHILDMTHSWSYVFSITGLQCLVGMAVYVYGGTGKQII